MKEYLAELARNVSTPSQGRNVAREYLQARILGALQRAGAMIPLAAKAVPVAIAEFVGRYTVNINGMMAGGILAALPPVLLGLIFQCYIVSGMTAGAVKG